MEPTEEQNHKANLKEVMKRGRKQRAKNEEEMSLKLEDFLRTSKNKYDESEEEINITDNFVGFVSSLIDESDDNTRGSVGIVFDKVMLKHQAQYSHPERPGRILKPLELLLQTNTLAKLKPLNGRRVEKEELLRIHDELYLDVIASIPTMTSDERYTKESSYNSIYICEDTYECALVSCGCTLVLIENILNKSIRSGVALVRPPGHHAEAHTACGFCFYNNVAVAARHAQSINKACKVLIFDWDIHHGNGTQHMFYNDPSVLYISFHRFDNSMFFPSSSEADYFFSGEDDGAGHNINVAWNGGPMGDAEYLLAFETIVMPVALKFNPDLVIVSAGFDAAKGDPLGGYKVSPAAYGYMSNKLHGIADGNVAIVLEGGYNLNSVSKSILSCTEALMELSFDTYGELDESRKHTRRPKTKLPKESAVESIINTINCHLAYWDDLSESLNTVEKVKEEIEMDKLEKELEMKLVLSDPSKGTTTRAQARRSESAENPIVKNDDANTQQSKIEEDDKTTSVLKVDNSETLNLIDFLDKDTIHKSEGIKEVEETVDSATTSEDTTNNHNPQTDSIQQFVIAVGNSSCDDIASLNLIKQLQLAGDESGYVMPLNDCPHLSNILTVDNLGIDISKPCNDCGHKDENWLCLTCAQVFCGRYVHEHMVTHYKKEDHCITMSYSDLSFWCYKCDAYLNNYTIKELKSIYNEAHIIKHQCEPH